jgi:hypothetical protein
LFAALFLFSCASGGKQSSPVNVFDYFSSDFDIYITIPVKGNENLISALAEILSPGMDLQPILSRITTLHAAFNIGGSGGELPQGYSQSFTQGFTHWQLVAEGRFPRAFAGLALNEKNGWVKTTAGSGENRFSWYESIQGGQSAVQVAIPNSSIVLASSRTSFDGGDMAAFLERFAAPAPQQWPPSPALLMDSRMDMPYELLPPATEIAAGEKTVAGEPIRFYLVRPEGAVKNLLGEDIRFPVTAVDGALFPSEGSEGEGSIWEGSKGSVIYLVNMRTFMGEPRVVRPAATLFRLLMGSAFPDASVEIVEGNTLYIHGLQIGGEKLIAMMGLNSF